MRNRIQCFLCMILPVFPCFAADIKILTPDNKIYQHILNKTHGYYKAWTYTREDTTFDQAGVYYSKNPNNVYWDPLPPLAGYRGWGEYQDVITRVWKPNGLAAAGILFAHDGSFRAWRYKDLIWTTGNCLVHAEYNARNTETMPCRGTQIWKKENDNWLIVHEHYSGTVNPGKKLFQGKRAADDRLKPNKKFLKLTRVVASGWEQGSIETAAGRLKQHYYTGKDLHLYMPWTPHDGYPDWTSFTSGLDEYVKLTATKLTLNHQEDLEATVYGDLAWSTATVELNFLRHDGSTIVADGRQTLMWFREKGTWRIVHEHLSIPMSH